MIDPQDIRVIDQARFTLRARRLGGRRPYSTFVTQGIGIVGEPGSSTHAARTPEASIRKAMRTVARLATERHLSPITIDVTWPDEPRPITPSPGQGQT